MNLLRRRRKWPHYAPENVILVDAPVAVTREFMEEKLDSDKNVYGVIDYVKFGLRPFYHLLGLRTRNAGGVICSEMIYNDLRECGWQHRFRQVPSPADLEKVFGVSWRK